MRRRVLLILLLLGLGTIGFARPIMLEGVDDITTRDLESKYPSLFNGTWNMVDLDQATKWMMSLRRFDQITTSAPREGEKSYLLKALPVRLIEDITVTGNNQLRTSEILEILGIRVGERFDRKVLVAGGEKLKDRYGNMGFFSMTVEIGFETPRPTQILIRVDVQEGDPCRMQNIVIDTPNVALREALGRRVSRLRGRPLTEERLTEMQDRFRLYARENRYLTAAFGDPLIDYNETRTAATIRFKVENPVRWDLIFDGNKKVTTATLLRNLELENFISTASSPQAELTTRLLDVYKNRGYATATVESSERAFTSRPFQKQVLFRIKEGSKVVLRSLSVVGNVSGSSEEYADIVESNSSDLVASGYYNRTALDAGVKNLQVELQNRGYLRARALSVRADFDEQKKNVDVLVNLDEGPLTRVRTLRLEGVRALPEADVLEKLALKEGDPLRLVDLEANLERIKALYQSKGYLEATLLNEKQTLVQYNEDNTQADVLIQIYEGPQVKVGSLLVEGNQKTKDYVIRQESGLSEGDILTSDAISDGTTRLLRLGIFSNVNISTLENGSNIALRTVVIQVEESNPGVFSSGIGANDEARLTFRTYAGVGYNNISGTARAATGRADFDYAIDPRFQFPNNTLTFGFFEPFLFGTRTRARLSLQRSERWFELGQTPSGLNTLTVLETMDGKVLIERDLTMRLKFIWQLYGYETLRAFEREDLYPERTNALIASMGPTLELDYRNSPINPTKGSFTRWNAEYARPEFGGSDLSGYFVRTESQVSHYLPVSGSRWVWANQVRGGFLQNLSDLPGAGVPVVRAFFLGSRTTVRGFEPALERFPNPNTLNNENESNFRLSGFRVQNNSTYYLIKTEMRFPLWGDLGGAVFYDGGAVHVSGYRIEDPYRDSVGFGLRYITPVGPVNLELGYKVFRTYLVRESPRPSPFRLHFSIGTF